MKPEEKLDKDIDEFSSPAVKSLVRLLKTIVFVIPPLFYLLYYVMNQRLDDCKEERRFERVRKDSADARALRREQMFTEEFIRMTKKMDSVNRAVKDAGL